MKSVHSLLCLALLAATVAASAADFTDAELEQLGRSFVQSINETDYQTFGALISARHMAKNVSEVAADTPEEARRMAASIQRAVSAQNDNMLRELERQQASAVYLRVQEVAGTRGPLVRYAVEAGFNYALLEPVRTGEGVRIGDMNFSTSGEPLSKTIGVAMKLMTSPSDSFLSRMFGLKTIDKNVSSSFKQVGELRQQGKLAEAFAVIDELPPEIRNHRLSILTALQLSAQFDGDRYRRELQRLSEHHREDPRVAFLLLDHYFFEGDFDSAVSIIDLMEKTYGTDAVMFMFRASVEIQRGRMDLAREFAHEAVKIEPEHEEMYWVLANTQIQSGKFDASMATLDTMAQKFGYQFTREDFESEPTYSEFIESDEFERWIAQQ